MGNACGSLLLVATVLSSCGGGTANPDGGSSADATAGSDAHVRSPYAGVWSGKTSRNDAVSLSISAEGVVQALVAQLRIGLGTGTCVMPFSASAVRIVGQTFETTLSSKNTNVAPKFRGTFTSEGAVTGSFDKASGSTVVCGGKLTMGTGISVAAGTWLAAKTAASLPVDAGAGTDGSTAAPNLAGSWSGTWAAGTVSGTMTLELKQSASAITGAVTFTGSPCLSSGSVSATLRGGSLTGTINGAGTPSVSVASTASATQITGTFSVPSGACAGSGTFTVSR